MAKITRCREWCASVSPGMALLVLAAFKGFWHVGGVCLWVDYLYRGGWRQNPKVLQCKRHPVLL
ncbi:MAG TPA: hypothetical protein ACQGQH_00960 [Xylella sp.]